MYIVINIYPDTRVHTFNRGNTISTVIMLHHMHIDFNDLSLNIPTHEASCNQLDVLSWTMGYGSRRFCV